MKEYLATYADLIVKILIAILVVCSVCYGIYSYLQSKEAKLMKAVVITEAQVTNVETAAQVLHTDVINAEGVKKAVEKVSSGSVAPTASFIQTAATVEDAAATVNKKINSGDVTLPSAFTQKTDRTFVLPQQVNSDWQVSAYKVNLKPRWEYGAGAGVYKDDFYVAVSIKDNYNRKDSVSVSLNLDPSNSFKPSGVFITMWHASN